MLSIFFLLSGTLDNSPEETTTRGNCKLSTLESGIVVLVGINVLVGTFVKINKHTGGNKRTGGKFC